MATASLSSSSSFSSAKPKAPALEPYTLPDPPQWLPHELPSAPNVDGRPVWEPPIIDYYRLIDGVFDKKKAAVMKLLQGDAKIKEKTTHVMDRLVQGELMVEYLLWASYNESLEDPEACAFFKGLVDQLAYDIFSEKQVDFNPELTDDEGLRHIHVRKENSLDPEGSWVAVREEHTPWHPPEDDDSDSDSFYSVNNPEPAAEDICNAPNRAPVRRFVHPSLLAIHDGSPLPSNTVFINERVAAMVNPSYAELGDPLPGQDPNVGRNERIEAYLKEYNAEIDREAQRFREEEGIQEDEGAVAEEGGGENAMEVDIDGELALVSQLLSAEGSQLSAEVQVDANATGEGEETEDTISVDIDAELELVNQVLDDESSQLNSDLPS